MIVKKARNEFEIGSTLRVSAFIALFLLFAFVTLWVVLGIDSLNLQNYLFGAIIFCVALVTVSVFQAFRLSESASIIAEGLAKDLVHSSHELFVELYKKNPVPNILINKVGVISSTNIAASRLFKVGVGELEGKNIFTFIDGDDDHHIDFMSDKFIRGLSIDDEEVRIECSDGTHRWVLLSLFPFKGGKTQQQGFLTLVDVTKQKNIDKAKSEFVSLASHQLRTPLTAMKWSLELLMEKNRDTFTESHMKYISKIDSNLERMTVLISDFLSVSKFELGTYSLDRAEVDFPAVIHEIIDSNLPRIESKHIDIQRDFDASVETIATDIALLRMVMDNLISNAIKYSHAGGVVKIEATKRGANIVITITDSGMGIPLEDQEMLFTKMFRARNARRDVPDGTGLGLYIADYAVKVLQGKISFESKEGKGTTFRVELPA